MYLHVACFQYIISSGGDLRGHKVISCWCWNFAKISKTSKNFKKKSTTTDKTLLQSPRCVHLESAKQEVAQCNDETTLFRD